MHENINKLVGCPVGWILIYRLFINKYFLFIFYRINNWMIILILIVLILLNLVCKPIIII